MGAKYPVKRPVKAKQLAEEFGVHIRTVYRKMAMPRDQYLAESLMRQKPWEALGISRATWYRRGKPMPESCNDHDHV
ncbi:MAG: rep protein [Candidatus Thermofonsia Clade 3 bacterium]|jgi:predicted DNA-binding transcriptional regulator YafY|uniref:Rep protein n=1 Tax=Candidatus Thermofonsia Clade 3 bacterium TaxID=2364212 RepID=A0A2M8Q9F8_9CHLR|nr:MAG: rep protein [Candidatus Thermofonsia Clade 3 bacterium]